MALNLSERVLVHESILIFRGILALCYRHDQISFVVAETLLPISFPQIVTAFWTCHSTYGPMPNQMDK